LHRLSPRLSKAGDDRTRRDHDDLDASTASPTPHFQRAIVASSRESASLVCHALLRPVLSRYFVRALQPMAATQTERGNAKGVDCCPDAIR